MYRTVFRAASQRAGHARKHEKTVGFTWVAHALPAKW